MIASDGRILAREAAITTFAAGSIAAVLLWAGPPGVDLAAHAYQRTFLLAPRVRALEQLLVRRALLVRHLQLHLLPARGAVRDQGAGARHDRRGGARLHAARLARVGAGRAALEPHLRRALGRHRPVGGLPVRARRRTRAPRSHGDAARPPPALRGPRAADAAREPARVPAARGAARRRRRLDAHPRTSASSRRSSALAVLLEVALYRIFPDSGRFPFGSWNLVPAVLFCVYGIVVTRDVPTARPLRGIFWIYLAACLAAYFVPSALGSNVERLRYAALPIVLLAVSLRRWRPAWLTITGVVLATVWNVTPLASSFAQARSDPGRQPRRTGPRPSRTCTRTSARASGSRRSTPPTTGRPSISRRTAFRSCAAGTARPTSPRTSCSTTASSRPDALPGLAAAARRPLRRHLRRAARLQLAGRGAADPLRPLRSRACLPRPARDACTRCRTRARSSPGPGSRACKWLWPTRAVLAVDRPGQVPRRAALVAVLGDAAGLRLPRAPTGWCG